ncbi:MAG: DUF268 domain-containing protein [Alphaproteobacteria bacterium]
MKDAIKKFLPKKVKKIIKKLLSLRYLYRFFTNYKQFVNNGGKITKLCPVLSNFNSSAGLDKGHYFHQDLLVASYINKANPERHIDIGSRIDGFVAHVASFREIEVMDIRELNPLKHKNIKFIQSDLMQYDDKYNDATDSISCLHAIEHFGLGRYGDPINPNGHIAGFKNILKMLKKNGMLYISFPIGKENQVLFNIHRIFDPKDIFKWSDEKLELQKFDFVDDNGDLHIDFPIKEKNIVANFGLGIYSFCKK